MSRKLWIVNQYSVTPEYPASTRHYEMAKYLSLYFVVTLWGSNFIHHNKSYRFANRKILNVEEMKSFRFFWLASLSYRGNGLFRLLNMVLYAVLLFAAGVFRRDKPDVIIGSSPPLFTAFSCYLLSKWKKSKFILEVRDLWPESFIEISGSRNKLVIGVLYWMAHKLYSKADQIIVLTEGIHRHLLNKNVSEDKLFFLPNGIDMETIRQDFLTEQEKKQMREQWGLKPDDFIFMYAGAHGPANDLEQLIHAADVLRSERNIKLVLIGEGAEKEKLIRSAHDLKLDEQVLFLPAVGKSEIQHFLSMADAFMICLKNVPLFNGALPNKLFDYLLHGKPVVTTVSGEVERFLKRFNIGEYGSMNAADEFSYLPSVMKRIAQETTKYGINGYEIIHAHFDRKQQAKQLAENIQLLFSREDVKK